MSPWTAGRRWIGATGCLVVASLAALTAAAVPGSPAAVRLPTLKPLAWVPNGPIYGAAPMGDRLVIGGSFTKIAPRTGQAALLDRTTGAPEAGFPEFAGGAVNTVISDGAGGWFVGGSFEDVDGVAAEGLAHLRAGGAVDTHFAPSLAYVYNVTSSDPVGDSDPADVTALALAGTTLYVGGTFTKVDGVDRNGLAAFDVATAALTGWNPSTDAEGGFVRALAASGTVVYVAGGFSELGGATRNGVAAVDGTTGVATSWDPAPDQAVTSLALGAGVVYVGGSFTDIGGASRANIAALDPATGLATAWSPQLGDPVSAIVVAGDAVDVATGQSRNDPRTRSATVYSLAAAGGASRWQVTTNGAVETLAADGPDLLIGGRFRTIGHVARDAVAEVDAHGAPTAWNPHPNLLVDELAEPAAVETVVPMSGGIMIGGEFVSVGGVRRHGLASIDSTGKPSTWNPSPNGEISAVASGPNGAVYVAGSFQRIAGTPRTGAAEFDAAQKLLPWAPEPLAGGEANFLTVLGDKVIMTGEFDGVGRVDVHGSMAAFDARTGRLLDWGLPRRGGGGVGQIVVEGKRVVALNYDGAAVTLNPATGLAHGFSHNHGTGLVVGGAFSGRTFYIGGAMQAVDFHYRTRLAAFDIVTKKLLPWNPAADDTVYSLLVSHGVVFAGGQFRNVSKVPRRGLAAIDAESGRVLPWNGRLTGNVRQLVPWNGGFVALGEFLSAGGHVSPYLAVYGF